MYTGQPIEPKLSLVLKFPMNFELESKTSRIIISVQKFSALTRLKLVGKSHLIEKVYINNLKNDLNSYLPKAYNTKAH